ncbi:uncharacterized protein LOC129726167 [Wyeomyia smithii]|uniref:uncharacterized protein LOC129726167 n=1 Tax=Wyeomyia smithii TaxID=174621 RepID=UPI002467FBD4|nr:uncharacterized protein LOC129726167 [Wyeomyia smithii]
MSSPLKWSLIEVDRFRIVGYVYASGCIVFTIIESVAAVNLLIRDGCDTYVYIKLLLALLFLTFNIFLFIGISTANLANVHANTVFTVLFDLIIMANVVLNLSFRIWNEETLDRKKEGLVAMVLVTLFIAMSIFQLWVLSGVRQYIKHRRRVQVIETTA